ncbi:sodium:calcium antiporter [Thalassoglobus polymorphus]|uniref:Putative calcium/sodium:proton antiporter n=1 Tax=Thalassoglobus polymorphus TaxID=2527994 RepID=A0A517QU46_9PLAN|nr:sodium:calcium antiporter [Thalassoglobus polymorphus]QDT35165.1 putative calcium/sodium:proton antiporter [Thalassoglobus polymorphus]
MTELLLMFVGLSVVIVIAAIFLASSADVIAEGTNLGRSMAGLILLAGATSLPELMVGWTGVKIEAFDLTIGELLGSCLLNLLILALMDLLTRTKGTMLSRMSSAHALSAATCVLLATIVLISLLLRIETTFLRLGVGSWVVAVVYFGCMRLIYKDQKMQESTPEPASSPETVQESLVKAFGIYIAAAAVIFFAAPKLAVSADHLAHESGLGETFFGTVFVALITSLPELVATYTAIRIGAFDMAVGNIFGSNCINIFIISIVDAASASPILSVASLTHTLTAASVVLITTVAVVSLLYRAKKGILLLEPDAIMIILLVIGSLYLVYQPPTIGLAQ